MKIKRPLINQFYEEDDQEPEEQTHEPLERPAFTHIKPLEQANQEDNLPTPSIKEVLTSEPPEQKEVVIQTKPSEAFLKWKKEQEEKAKADAQVKAIAEQKANEEAKRQQELIRQEQIRLEEEMRTRAAEAARTRLPALPKTAVKAEEMPQKPKVVKKQEPLVIPDEQLDFGISPRRMTFKDRIDLLKLYFERRQELLEISMLWKNPSLPFNIVSVIFVTGLLFIGGIFEFDRIPLKIPVFYNHVEKSWEQTDKSTLFIMGIVLLITEGFLINIITKIFRTDRRLALTLSWVITFINVLIIIAALQIYSLIT